MCSGNDTKHFTVNRCVCRILGYSEQELLGRKSGHPSSPRKCPTIARAISSCRRRSRNRVIENPCSAGMEAVRYAVTAIEASITRTALLTDPFAVTLPNASVPKRHCRRNTATSSTCCTPATTNGNSSPTKSTTGWPSSWPGRSCSSRLRSPEGQEPQGSGKRLRCSDNDASTRAF